MLARLLTCAALLLAVLVVSCDSDEGVPEGGVEITQAPSGATAVATEEQPAGSLDVALTEHDFGDLCLGFCRETLDVPLGATSSDIEILGLSIDSTRTESAFEVRSMCEDVIEEGEACDLRLVFRPRTLGAHDLVITIDHTGEDSPATIRLDGVGICPEGSEPVPDSLLGLLDEREGFGAEVTGGAGGCTYVVDSDSDEGDGSLREVAEAGGYWITFARDLEIQLDSNIDLAGDTTIDGRGRVVNITGAGMHTSGRRNSNIIVNDLRMAHSGGNENDLLQVTDGATEFWFHHLELADATDEYIDISKARPAGAVGTISWTHFARGGPQNTNELVVLIGDDGGAETNHLLHVTLHHNWFDGTRQRHPMVTGANVHTFNNVIQWRLWGIQARHSDGDVGAQVVSENDVFDGLVSPPQNLGDGARLFDDGNFLRVTNPLLLNGAGVSESNPERRLQPRRGVRLRTRPGRGCDGDRHERSRASHRRDRPQPLISCSYWTLMRSTTEEIE